MDTNTNFKISIPKPCHEDWNKFTPDEKGAFCKVCSKSVYDFTKKTAEEIKTVLVEQMTTGAKVCGRFNEDQLTPAVQPIPALNPYTLNFTRLKKFAIALFFVFGGYLFNSVKSSAQKMGKIAIPQYSYPIRGEIAVARDPEPIVKDTARVVRDSFVTRPKVSHCSKMLKGDVMVEPIQEQKVKGNLLAEPIVGQTIIEKPIVGDTTVTLTTTVEETPMIMGMMVAMPYEPPILTEPIPRQNDSVGLAEDSIQGIIDGEFAVEESTYVEVDALILKGEQEINIPNEEIDINIPKIECYPNASSNGVITLRYNMKKGGIASISLFDLKGNLVKTLLPLQSLYASTYETRFDISDLPSGIYFCTLQTGDKKSTVKIILGK